MYVHKRMQCFTRSAAQDLDTINVLSSCKIEISQELIAMHLLAPDEEPMHPSLADVFNDTLQVSDCHTNFDWNYQFGPVDNEVDCDRHCDVRDGAQMQPQKVSSLSEFVPQGTDATDTK